MQLAFFLLSSGCRQRAAQGSASAGGRFKRTGRLTRWLQRNPVTMARLLVSAFTGQASMRVALKHRATGVASRWSGKRKRAFSRDRDASTSVRRVSPQANAMRERDSSNTPDRFSVMQARSRVSRGGVLVALC